MAGNQVGDILSQHPVTLLNPIQPALFEDTNNGISNHIFWNTNTVGASNDGAKQGKIGLALRRVRLA